MHSFRINAELAIAWDANSVQQRFSNGSARSTRGTRRPSRWYANRPTTFCLSS